MGGDAGPHRVAGAVAVVVVDVRSVLLAHNQFNSSVQWDVLLRTELGSDPGILTIPGILV